MHLHLYGRLLTALSVLLLWLPPELAYAQTASRHVSLDNGKHTTDLRCPAKAPAG